MSRRVALQIFRLAVLVAIAWVLRAHAVKMRVEGHAPIALGEVRAIFPEAATLRDDPGERAGKSVAAADGRALGYVLRTMPEVEKILGYRGWTDVLVAFDPAQRVVGVRIRTSQDTREHVGDVAADRHFLKTWNGKAWEQVAGMRRPEQEGIEGVSGASLTSLAIAEGITARLRAADLRAAVPPPALRVKARDLGLAFIIAAALALAFSRTHRRGMRVAFHVVVIGYVGFWNGDLLAQSLVVGWAQNGVPWPLAPGLALLLAAALAVPWATGKPLYCQHLCPHGAAQELLARVAPRRWRIALPRDFAAGLRWLPPLLLAFILAIALLALPLDLASVEPFDAYLVKTAGLATIALAVAGLVAALFVPMAYCRYGCPTGALLEFFRARGATDRFSRRDAAALALLAFAWALLYWQAPLRELLLRGV